MMTLRRFAEPPTTIPAATSWYLADLGEVEARPRMEGNQMFIIFGPKRHKGATKPEHPAPQPTGAS